MVFRHWTSVLDSDTWEKGNIEKEPKSCHRILLGGHFQATTEEGELRWRFAYSELRRESWKKGRAEWIEHTEQGTREEKDTLRVSSRDHQSLLSLQLSTVVLVRNLPKSWRGGINKKSREINPQSSQKARNSSFSCQSAENPHNSRALSRILRKVIYQ